MDYLIKIYVSGGFMMHIISFVFLIALFIVLERFVYLFIRANIKAKPFMDKIFDLYKQRKINDAIEICNKSNKPLSKIIGAALIFHERIERDIQDAVDEVFLAEAPNIKKFTPLLSILSQISTMLGLLGTIFGLIDAFSALNNVNPALRTEMLANGISKAMGTTAYGLLVAIFSIFFYAILNAKAERIIDDIDEYSVKMLNFIKKYR